MKIGIGIALLSFLNFIFFYVIEAANFNVRTGNIFAIQIFLGLLIFIIELMCSAKGEN